MHGSGCTTGNNQSHQSQRRFTSKDLQCSADLNRIEAVNTFFLTLVCFQIDSKRQRSCHVSCEATRRATVYRTGVVHGTVQSRSVRRYCCR